MSASHASASPASIAFGCSMFEPLSDLELVIGICCECAALTSWDVCVMFDAGTSGSLAPHLIVLSPDLNWLPV